MCAYFLSVCYMVTLILAAAVMMAFDIQSLKADGPIYIRADGSIKSNLQRIQ